MEIVRSQEKGLLLRKEAPQVANLLGIKASIDVSVLSVAAWCRLPVSFHFCEYCISKGQVFPVFPYRSFW